MKSLAVSLEIEEHIHWHGYLRSKALDQLLRTFDIGLVTNKTNTLVACPNKACAYAAYGLPTISCLRGEYQTLIQDFAAGENYTEGAAHLHLLKPH